MNEAPYSRTELMICLLIPEQVGVNEPPSDEELHLLREEIDRQRFYI